MSNFQTITIEIDPDMDLSYVAGFHGGGVAHSIRKRWFGSASLLLRGEDGSRGDAHAALHSAAEDMGYASTNLVPLGRFYEALGRVASAVSHTTHGTGYSLEG